jgi:hypothetical protein
MQIVGAFATEIPGNQKQQLFEIRIERRMPCLLDAQFHAHEHRSRAQDHVHGAFDIRPAHSRMINPSIHRYRANYPANFLEVMRVSIDEDLILTASL